MKTTGTEPATAERYEFGIAGTIGPTIADGLPELSIVTAGQWTRLAGTVDGPDDLRRVLDLLSAHGVPAVNIRLVQRP